MVLGSAAAFSADPQVFLLMGTAGLRRVSIVGLLCVTFLPLLITALAVYFSKAMLLFGVCFFRAWFLGYMLRGLMLSIGSGFWMYSSLLMFSSLALLPLDCWLWVRYVAGDRRFYLRDFLIYGASAAVIVALDHFLIAPLLAEVMLF